MSEVRTRWLPGIVLVVTLYLMYAPVFLTNYLMNDEWHRIGQRTTIAESARVNFFSHGRALYGICSSLTDRFVQYEVG